MPSKSLWTEHISKDGRKYYYNQETKKSQWDKPDELKSEHDLKVEAKTKWRSFASAEGKIFYYNTETKESVWDIPDEIKNFMDEDDNLAENVHDNTKTAFLSFLENFNFTQKTTWESALKVLETDDRWSLFSILSKGDKKQLFSEFSSQIHRRKQDEVRKKRSIMNEVMIKELSSWDGLTYSTTYVNFGRKFHKCEWWDWADEQAKNSIFQEFIEKEASRFKKKKRESKISSMDKLIDIMTLDYEQELKPWDEAKKKYLSFEGLYNIDILSCHKYVFKEVYSKKYEEAKKNCYRLQRKLRERFLIFLKECVERGEIREDTKFSEFISKHSTEAVYVDLVGQPGSTPIDLFTEVQNTFKNSNNFVI